jgi:hypothetical protein
MPSQGHDALLGRYADMSGLLAQNFIEARDHLVAKLFVIHRRLRAEIRSQPLCPTRTASALIEIKIKRAALRAGRRFHQSGRHGHFQPSRQRRGLVELAAGCVAFGGG